jgi:hypothetical protein
MIEYILLFYDERGIYFEKWQIATGCCSGDVKCRPAAVYYPIDEAATLVSQISRERGKVA